MKSNKQCNAHWEGHLHQDEHHEKPLFDVFTSKESLHWVLLVRHIDVRGWELRLRDPESKVTEPKNLSHFGSLFQVCQAGEVDIVKAMVERTQVDTEARGDEMTPLHAAAERSHRSIVQHLCEQGADKEARSGDGRTPPDVNEYKWERE